MRGKYMKYVALFVGVLMFGATGVTIAPPASAAPSCTTICYVADSVGGGQDTNPGTPASPLLSIQAAINQVSVGGSVIVEAAAFTDPHVNVNKTISLYGFNQGVDPCDRPFPDDLHDTQLLGALGAEGSGATPLTISANDVTVSGFDIYNNTADTGGGTGVRIEPGVHGTHITDNIIKDNITGIYLAASSAPGDPTSISSNLFTQNFQPGSHSGANIYADNTTAGGPVVNVQISSNCFVNTGLVPFSSASSVSIGLYNHDVAHPFDNIAITGNDFEESDTGVILVSTADSTVTGNNFEFENDFNLPPAIGPLQAVWLCGAPSCPFAGPNDTNRNISIAENEIGCSLCEPGYKAVLTTDRSATGIAINRNDLAGAGNPGFVASDATATEDGNCNAWTLSSASPPRVGVVVGSVDVSTWILTSSFFVFPPSAKTTFLAAAPCFTPHLPDAPGIGNSLFSPAAATVDATGTASVFFTGLTHDAVSQGDGGIPILHYDATCTSTDGGATRTAVTPVASEATVPGLSKGKTYNCTVSATNAVGTGPQSDPSNSVSVPASAPDVPTIGTAAGANGAASVAFTPGSDGGLPVTYNATCTSSDAGAATPVSASGTASPVAVPGLTTGSSYACSVTATNTLGTSAPSGQSNTFLVATAPAAPTIGAVTAGDQSLSVAFTAGSNGGSPVLHFDVTCTSLSGPISASGTVSPIVLSGLTVGRTYTCTVTAMNAAGTSPPSGQSSGVVVVTVPGAPTIIGAIPTSTSSLSVAFTPPASNGGAPITNYAAICFLDLFNSPVGAPAVGLGTQSPVTVSGLGQDNLYFCSVTATNVAGTGPASASTLALLHFGSPPPPPPPYTVPGAPPIPTAKPGSGQVTLTWTPGQDGGSPILGYVVTPYLNGVAQKPVVFFTPDTTEIVTGLINGDTYTFKIAAINRAGTGPQSQATLPITVGAPVPAVVQAAKVASGAIKVTFRAPANNGAVITKYTATCTSTNGGHTRAKSGKTSPIVVTGLTARKTYTCRVVATNRRGASPPSHRTGSIKA